MEANIIHADVRDSVIKLREYVPPTAGNVAHDKLEIHLDSKWGSLEKRVTFYRECGPKITLAWDGVSAITIPWEVLAEPGIVAFTVVGSEDGTDRLVTKEISGYNAIRVAINGEDEGIDPSAPTEDILRRVERVAGELEGSEQARQEAFQASQDAREVAFGAFMEEKDREIAADLQITYGATQAANAAAASANQAADDVRGMAQRGDFDGVSPTASVQRVDGGAVITITDADGTTTAEVLDGHDGGEPYDDTDIRNQLASVVERVEWIENVSTKADMSWAQIHEVVQAGKGAEYLPIGSQIEVPWVDIGANQRHVLLFDVMHHYDGSDDDHPLVECEDGASRRGVCLQLHRTIPFGVVWSPKQAFYCTEGGLAAGTYCFDVEVVTTWGSTGEWATKGTRTYKFTLSSAVPAGGQLVFSGDPYTAKLPTMSVQAFAPFGATASQTVPISEGAGGTKLGAVTTSCHGGFNAYPRATYGNNAWRESCEREWLNASAAKGAWNLQKTPWDRPHALAATKAGFLAGFEADFLGALASCRHMTETHPGDPAVGAVVETFDRFFFPSACEHYFTNYLSATAAGYAAEGVPWDYWKMLAEANGKTGPWAGWGTFPELITYDNTAWSTSRYVWLRSAYRYVTYSCSVGFVSTSGYVSSHYAYNGYYAAPACIIC